MVENGENPLEETIRLRAIKLYVETALKELEYDAMDEAEKYGKSDSVIGGVGFTTRQSGARYYYDHDDEWNRLKEAIKKREAFLKSLPGEVADTESGEIIQPAEVRYGKQSLVVSFPRE